MSEVTEAIKEPLVWTVEAHSWTCNVPMDAYNASFDMEKQAHEAATKAVEAYKGRREDIILLMKEGHDKRTLGGTLLVYPKDSDPKKGIPIFTYVCLADAGLYKESWAVFTAIVKHQEAQQAAREAEIKQFEKSMGIPPTAQEQAPDKAKTEQPVTKKPRKPRKKKIDEPPKPE